MNQIIETTARIWNSLPDWLASMIVLALGWILAVFLRFLMTKFLKLVRFDKASEKTGFSEFLRKGNVKYTPIELTGTFVFWIVLAITFFTAAEVLNIDAVNAILVRLGEIVPGAIAAIFIVVIGSVVVSFLSNFLLTIARNASLPNADLFARAVKYLGIILIVAMAFEQLKLGQTVFSTLLLIVVGAAVFGVALAFGLGCKDIARNAVQRILDNLRERDRVGKGSDLEG